MKWLELSVQAPPEFVEPLSQIFHRYGHGGVAMEVEGGFNPDEGESPPTHYTVTVKTYLPLDPTTDQRRNQIDLSVRLVAHFSPISILHERVLEEEEWQSTWKEHFHVLHVGRRIVICPTWRDYDGQESDVIITLDPGMAFGTGHHPTTRMCLEQLEDVVKPGMKVLDVGCGSGILSIAAAKLGAESVFGLEIDSVAADVARQNVRENHVEESVGVTNGSLPHPDAPMNSYDVAVVNISAKVVIEIAGEMVKATKPAGKVLASGILLDNKEGVERALISAGANLEETLVDGDWVALVASRI